MKALGIEMEAVLIEVSEHVSLQREPSKCPDTAVTESLRMENATPERFLALAKTELQTGLMYATRAVAQPEFF